MSGATASIGELLRDWRRRRRMSQLDLATEAEISARHLSFLETGRATPSRDMVMRLANHLDLPLRERNRLLLVAGFAPAHHERALDDPSLAAVRQAIELILKSHEPFPALAIDRHWQLVSANRQVMMLVAGAAPHLLTPPVNVLRLSLHPEGLAPRIENLAEWRGHLLERLARQINSSGDQALIALLQELKSLPFATGRMPPRDFGGVAVPLRLRTAEGTLQLYSMTTVFGTPLDVTLAELALETFLPADDRSGELLRRLCD
jgi:transcriptional regulator with XRE-family HTH domain